MLDRIIHDIAQILPVAVGAHLNKQFCTNGAEVDQPVLTDDAAGIGAAIDGNTLFRHRAHLERRQRNRKRRKRRTNFVGQGVQEPIREEPNRRCNMQAAIIAGHRNVRLFDRLCRGSFALQRFYPLLRTIAQFCRKRHTDSLRRLRGHHSLHCRGSLMQIQMRQQDNICLFQLGINNLGISRIAQQSRTVRCQRMQLCRVYHYSQRGYRNIRQLCQTSLEISTKAVTLINDRIKILKFLGRLMEHLHLVLSKQCRCNGIFPFQTDTDILAIGMQLQSTGTISETNDDYILSVVLYSDKDTSLDFTCYSVEAIKAANGVFTIKDFLPTVNSLQLRDFAFIDESLVAENA